MATTARSQFNDFGFQPSNSGSWGASYHDVQLPTATRSQVDDFGFQPNNSELWRAHQDSLPASPMGSCSEASFSSQSGRSRRPAKWTPSEREVRKYASLFLRADIDNDGFVAAADAKALAVRSGLDSHQLSLAWQLSDQDGDDYLSFREFIAFVHLVSCRFHGLELPSLDQGLPYELSATLASLRMAPQEYDAERRMRAESRSTSTSRSVSPASAHGTTSPAFGLSSFPPPSGNEGQSWPQESLTEQATASWAHNRISRGASDLPRGTPTGARAHGAWSTASYTGDNREEDRASVSSSSHSSPRFGRESQTKSALTVDVAVLRKQFKLILDADHMLSTRFRGEVNKLEEQIMHTKQLHDNLHHEMRREAEEGSHFKDMRSQLEHELAGLKQQLNDYTKQRMALGHGMQSTMNERRLFADEIAFLRQTLDEEKKMLEDVRSGSARLERSCKSLQIEIVDLEKQRDEFMEQAKAEKELFYKEQRRTLEMRDELEQLRQAQGANPTLQQNTERTVADPAASAPKADSFEWAFRPSEPSAWATTLVGSPATAVPSTNSASESGGGNANRAPLRMNPAGPKPWERAGV